MKTKEAVCKRIILSIFFLLVLCRTAGAQDSQKATLTAADAGTCSATSTACLVINIPSGSGGATFNIGANASANTIQFEASADYGTTWVALSVTPSSSTTTVTSTTSTGAWQANVAGYTKARMRISTLVGGNTTAYINLSTASARSNGGGGSVTHTAGNLTAFHLMLGNGLADSTVDSACLTNGTGALSGCTSISAGSGASAAGATATGGFAAIEAANTGWTPTAGQDYCRADSTLHSFVCAENGAAEGLIGNVNTGQTNVYGAFLQDFTAATMELPEAAGFTTNVNSTIGLDTTANTCKVWVNSADAICAVEATAIAAGFMPKSTDATHGLLVASLCDEGITAANTLTCTDTAGIVIPKIGTGSAPPACAVATSAWCGVESVPPTAVAGVDDLWPDTTDHSWKAHSNGNGIELVTLVAPTPIHQTAQTAAITTATLCTAANCGVAGNYTIEWAFTQVGTACGTPGAGGVTFLLTWTDQNAVTHSAIQMPMDDAASLVATTGTFHFTTSNATAWGSGNMNISSNGAILQYATGYTACGVGTGSYQLDAWVTRKR